MVVESSPSFYLFDGWVFWASSFSLLLMVTPSGLQEKVYCEVRFLSLLSLSLPESYGSRMLVTSFFEIFKFFCTDLHPALRCKYPRFVHSLLQFSQALRGRPCQELKRGLGDVDRWATGQCPV